MIISETLYSKELEYLLSNFWMFFEYKAKSLFYLFNIIFNETLYSSIINNIHNIKNM